MIITLHAVTLFNTFNLRMIPNNTLLFLVQHGNGVHLSYVSNRGFRPQPLVRQRPLVVEVVHVGLNVRSFVFWFWIHRSCAYMNISAVRNKNLQIITSNCFCLAKFEITSFVVSFYHYHLIISTKKCTEFT